MQKYLFILLLFSCSIQLNSQTKYNYQRANNYDELLQHLPSFWSHVKEEFSQLQNKSVLPKLKAEIKFALLVDFSKWEYNHIQTRGNATANKKDSLNSFIQKNVREINNKYELGISNIGELEEYLAKDVSEQELMSISNLVSKYQPAATADIYLNNFTEFLRVDFKDNLPNSVQDVFPLELKILNSDYDRFKSTFNNKQKARYDAIMSLFQSKEAKWNKDHQPKYIEGGIDVVTAQ